MGEKQGPRLTGARSFGSSDVFKALMIRKPGGEQVETRSDRRRSDLPGLGVSQAGQKQARDQAKQRHWNVRREAQTMWQRTGVMSGIRTCVLDWLKTGCTGLP